ncbi:hypothetical protein [Streptomyces uncialis]|uniref:hypothetical protein n=1 Tax=Streptomyces uncialis TaxID=1048205 RepID=UPI003798175F
MQRSMVEARGMQPEDVGVLAALLLRDPGRPATAKAMAADLRELGWKMSLDRFQKVVERLTAAGHMHRESVFNPASGRPEWVSRVYRNPANNAGYATRGSVASSQVSGGIGENPIPGLEGWSELGENPISPGQSDIGENPMSLPESGFPRFRDQAVSAGQQRNQEIPDSASSPPHTPPGGLVNPPTVPPRSTTPGSGADAVAGGNTMRTAPNTNPAAAGDVSEAELKAAGEFLEMLPGRWACGPQDVAKYAALVAEAVRRRGWPLNDEFEQWLTADERSIRGAYPRVIPARLKNLPRHAAWSRRPEAHAGSGPGRGAVEDPCPQHPHRSAAACVPCRSSLDDGDQAPAAAAAPVAEAAPDVSDVIAGARAFLESGKSRRRRGDRSPRGDARARRQAAAGRSAAAEAEAEENRRKAAALLAAAETVLDQPTVPAQNHDCGLDRGVRP